MSGSRFRSSALLAILLATACGSEDVVLFEFGEAAEMPTAGSGGMSSAGTSSVPEAGTGGTDASAAGSGGTTVAGSGGTETEGDAGAASTPISCHDDNDCPDAWSCEKSSCSASVGSCIPHPVCFDVAPDPVCGCDGITYWNDCLRKQVGPSASTRGECGIDARRCWERRDCGGENTECGLLVLPTDTCKPWPDGPHGPDPDPPGPPDGREPYGTCWAIPDHCDASLDPLRWTPCDGMDPGPQTSECTDTCGALRSGWPHIKNVSGTCP